MSETETNNSKNISLLLVPIVALGFASTQLSWALFNIAIPVILQDTYGVPILIVGFIMTWDNIIAFFVQPYIGSKSDQTRTRFGRRFPYIIPGIILGSIFFFLIPFAKPYHILIFLGVIVLFNLSMAIYRSPAVSLMPDLVESEKRSIGNGIVNLVGGVFSGASLFIAGGLLEDGNTTGAFAFVSIGMIISLIILVSVIREPKQIDLIEEVEEEEQKPIFQLLRDETSRMVRAKDKSLLFMLLAILSWFIAWNAIEAFYSTYVWKVFLPSTDAEVASGVAGKLLFIFPIAFVIFTIVGGILGTYIGRIRTMKIGLSGMTLAILIGATVERTSTLGIEVYWKFAYQLIFIFAGMGWGLVNVNSIVVVWEHSIDNGTGTGIYYAFASAAAILGPTIAGGLMYFSVYLLFPFSILFLLIALVMLFRVSSGEAGQNINLVKERLTDAVEEIMD